MSPSPKSLSNYQSFYQSFNKKIIKNLRKIILENKIFDKKNTETSINRFHLIKVSYIFKYTRITNCTNIERVKSRWKQREKGSEWVPKVAFRVNGNWNNIHCISLLFQVMEKISPRGKLWIHGRQSPTK